MVIAALPSPQALRAAAALGRSRPLVELLKAIDRNDAGSAEAIAFLDDAALGRFAMLLVSRNPSASTRARVARALRQSPADPRRVRRALAARRR